MRSNILNNFVTIWLYFFPLVTLSFLNLYLIKSGQDPKSFFMANVGLQVFVITIWLCSSIFKRLTKRKLEQTKQDRLNQSIAIGGFCLFAAIVINFFLYFEFMVAVIPVSFISFTVVMGIFAGFALSSIMALLTSSFFKVKN